MTRSVRETATLSESELTFVDEVDEVAVQLAQHRAGSAGSEGRVDRKLVAALGRTGLLRRLFCWRSVDGADSSAGRGGGRASDAAELPSDAAALQLCLLRESLARVDGEAETALALQGLGSYPILQSGRPEQVERWIPRVASGDVVAAFALSEPDAGSDAAALALEARPAGSGWTLHGTKTWISNAPDADVYTVFARTGPEAGSRGVTAFAVDGAAPGLTGEPLEMLSPHAIGRLDFDGVRVSPSDVLGEVGGGFAVAMRTLDLFRPSVGAFAVGMAESALAQTLSWVSSRRMYGGLLAEQQAVQHVLAEMATRTDAARLLVHRAARAYDAGLPAREVSAMAAMAKLFATENAQWVVDQSVQLHGARALQRGHPLEHLYRDVRAPRIYEGASEVQRTIIARHLLAQQGIANQNQRSSP